MANLKITLPIRGEQLTLIPGDTISSRAGQAIVTRLEATGQERIIWADYGSGIEQPHVEEGLLSPEPSPQRQRRYSPKGHASGWIEERLGNLKRKTPSISFYYRWQAGEQRGTCYIPIRKMAQVQQMLRDRRSVDEVLSFLSKCHTTPTLEAS